jgi:mannose-6-phosphate isomerase-like protein (cupin superfamily)
MDEKRRIIVASEALDLSRSLLGLDRDGNATLVPSESGPPPRIDGFVIGAPIMTRNPPHGGEMHPDGDEVLFLISGHVELILGEDGTETVVEVRPGQAMVVPRGVWHRVLLREPSQLLHITPGPGGEWRLPQRDGAV